MDGISSPDPKIEREPITQAKIDRVFGLNEKADALAEKGRNKLQFARLMKRWAVTRNRQPTPEEFQKLKTTFEAQGFNS